VEKNLDSLQIPIGVMVTYDPDTYSRNRGDRFNADNVNDTVDVRISRLTDMQLADILVVAKDLNVPSCVKMLETAISLRLGEKVTKVPNLFVLPGVLQGYMKEHFINGWLFETLADGSKLAWGVTHCALERVESYKASNKIDLSCNLTAVAYGPDETGGRNHLFAKPISKTWKFSAQSVNRRHIENILASKNLEVETPELVAAYQAEDKRYVEFCTMYGKQFRCVGPHCPVSNYNEKHEDVLNHKCVMDVPPSAFQPSRDRDFGSFALSDADDNSCELPSHHVLLCFDLATHRHLKMNTANLEPYKYRPELREKLILPASQVDMLDILTSKTDVFMGDIIEGKYAANIILCKGKPGVGKTLTAEVYAEITGRPLYMIHAGVLGITPGEIAIKLREVFSRVAAWGAILLLDEADVFVMQRGSDILHNSIVAEFLRVLESFSELMFMTTNRPDDIDEAIISRCAAILHFEEPQGDLARKIWKVMGDNFGVDMPPELVEQLVLALPGISARDMNRLTNLTARVASARKEPLTLDTFRQSSIFRGLTFKTENLKAS
jgi:hypothetical protein